VWGNEMETRAVYFLSLSCTASALCRRYSANLKVDGCKYLYTLPCHRSILLWLSLLMLLAGLAGLTPP
jgi:hypothetical protein